MEVSDFTDIKISDVMPESWMKLAVEAYTRYVENNKIMRDFQHIYFNMCPNGKNCMFSSLGGCKLGRCIHSYPTEREIEENFR